MFKEEKTEVPDVARVEEVTTAEGVAPTRDIPKTSVPRSKTSECQTAPINDHSTEATPQPDPERTSLPAVDSEAPKDGSERHQETKEENLPTHSPAEASKANDDDDDDPELTRQVSFQHVTNNFLFKHVMFHDINSS